MVPWLLSVLYFDRLISDPNNVFSLLTLTCKQAMGIVNYFMCTYYQVYIC